jgi:hypothetical protein
MPHVVNKHYHVPSTRDIYIGRPSPLANRWSSKPSKFPEVKKVTTREEAIAHYQVWLHEQVAGGNMVVVNALLAIPRNANLVCYCAPNPCHGHVVARYVDDLHAALRAHVRS